MLGYSTIIRKFETKVITAKSRKIGRQISRHISWAILTKKVEKHGCKEHGVIRKFRDETEKEVLNYGITDVWQGALSKKLYIKLTRPGIMIGLKGINIKYIEDFIKVHSAYPCKGIAIVEDRNPLTDDLLAAVSAYDYAGMDW